MVLHKRRNIQFQQDRAPPPTMLYGKESFKCNIWRYTQTDKMVCKISRFNTAGFLLWGI